MRLTVTANTELAGQFFRTTPDRVKRAIVRSINRAAGSARSVIVKGMAAETGMKQKDLRDGVPLRKATFSKMEAQLSASLKRLPLIDFRATGPYPSRGKGHGVSYRLLSGRGNAPNAFIAVMSSGHRGVFVRTTKARLPIHELRGPSLGKVFEKYRPAAAARAEDVIKTNLAHELAFVATGTDVSIDVSTEDDG